MLLGAGAQIPKHIDALFVTTGTAHVLAISGFNIGIVTAVIFLLLRILPIPRKAQILLTILLLIFYCLMTGGRPPVVRATIMAAVYLSGFLLQRETDTFNSLSLAAFIILLINPFALWDVGFQLSFISVVMIVVLYPRLTKLEAWEQFENFSKPVIWLGQSAAVSLCAWVGVAGLIVYYFHIITPIGILANLIIIPLSSVIVALGLGFMLSVIGCPFLTVMMATCIKFLLNLMVYCAYIFAQIPWAYIHWKGVSLWQVTVYYIILLFLIFGKWGMWFWGKRIDKRK
jgi:competence protein ComEC